MRNTHDTKTRKLANKSLDWLDELIPENPSGSYVLLVKYVGLVQFSEALNKA